MRRPAGCYVCVCVCARIFERQRDGQMDRGRYKGLAVFHEFVLISRTWQATCVCVCVCYMLRVSVCVRDTCHPVSATACLPAVGRLVFRYHLSPSLCL